MNISGLTVLDKVLSVNDNPAIVKTTPVRSRGFEDIFNAYFNLINETNAYQTQAEKLQLDYAAGRTDDMLALTLAQNKAHAVLTFTVQVTNKLIEAYREIMRIQI